MRLEISYYNKICDNINQLSLFQLKIFFQFFAVIFIISAFYKCGRHSTEKIGKREKTKFGTKCVTDLTKLDDNFLSFLTSFKANNVF